MPTAWRGLASSVDLDAQWSHIDDRRVAVAVVGEMEGRLEPASIDVRAALFLAWNVPALSLERITAELRDQSFRFRIARVHRLRLAGRDREADRTLLTIQAGIAARRA